MHFGPTDFYRKIGRAWLYQNGQRYTLTELPSRTVSLDSRSTCSGATRELAPDNVGGTPYRAEIELAGRLVSFYQGHVGKRAYGVAPIDRTSHGLDLLAKLQRSGKDACGATDGLLFDQTPYPDALKMTLNRAGIEDSELVLPFPDPGNGVMVVGAVDPICYPADENLDGVFSTLLKMGGCNAYVLPASGKLMVLPIERLPPENPSIVYSNHISGAYRTNHVEQTMAGIEDVVCIWTSTGGSVEDGVEVEATWVAPDIEGKADGNQCDLWQTMPQVEWAAEFYGRLACREEQLFQVSAPMDPEMLPGMSILLHEPNDGIYNAPAYVLSVATGGDRNTEMTMLCSLGPSQIEGYNQGLLPIADFVMVVVAERVLVSGQPQKRYEVFCDASSSFDSDGEITSYTWEVIDAAEQVVAPVLPVGNAAQVVIVLDSIAGLSVRLKVADDNEPANSARLAQALEGPGQQTYVRVLSTTNGDTWSVLATTNGWRRYQRPGYTCVAVPKYNDAGPLLSLWSDRSVHTTADYLATDATLLATLPGSGTISDAAMFVNEADGDDWLIGAGNTLYRTTNAGQTWEEIETFGGPIADCELGFEAGTGYMRVLVNNSAQYSVDGGVTWDTSAIAPVGATAEAMASGFGRHMAAVSGSTHQHAVLFDVGEGGPVDWSPVGAPPTELVATTPGLATDMYTVADPLGNLYTLTEDGVGGFAAAFVDTHIGAVAQLVRDGRFGGPGGQGIVYGAGAPTLKLLNNEALYELDTMTSQGIGYGALYVPPPSGWYVLLPQRNVVQGGVYQVWPDGTFALHNAGLPSQSLWGQWVVANPLNSQEWLALIYTNGNMAVANSGGKLVSDGSTYSPLWRWDGTQWQEVIVSSTLSTTAIVPRVEFDPETSGRWMMVATHSDHTAYLYTGDATSTTEHLLSSPGTQPRGLLLSDAGTGGDTVLYQNYVNEYVLYADTTGTLHQPSPNIGDIDCGFHGARWPGQSRAMALRADDHTYRGYIYVSADYRGSAAPVLVRGAGSAKCLPSITGDGRLLVATGSGVIEVTDPFGTPGEQTVMLAGTGIYWIHCDAQTRQLVAAYAATTDIVVWDSANGSETIIDTSDLASEATYVHIVTEA